MAELEDRHDMLSLKFMLVPFNDDEAIPEDLTQEFTGWLWFLEVVGFFDEDLAEGFRAG